MALKVHFLALSISLLMTCLVLVASQGTLDDNDSRSKSIQYIKDNNCTFPPNPSIMDDLNNNNANELNLDRSNCTSGPFIDDFFIANLCKDLFKKYFVNCQSKQILKQEAYIKVLMPEELKEAINYTGISICHYAQFLPNIVGPQIMKNQTYCLHYCESKNEELAHLQAQSLCKLTVSVSCQMAKESIDSCPPPSSVASINKVSTEISGSENTDKSGGKIQSPLTTSIAGEEKKTPTASSDPTLTPEASKTPTVSTAKQLPDVEKMKPTNLGSGTGDGKVPSISANTTSSPPVTVNGPQRPNSESDHNVTETINITPETETKGIETPERSFTTPNNSVAEAKHDKIPESTSISSPVDQKHTTEEVIRTTKTPKSFLTQITGGARKGVLVSSSAAPEKQATDTDSDDTALPSDTVPVKPSVGTDTGNEDKVLETSSTAVDKTMNSFERKEDLVASLPPQIGKKTGLYHDTDHDDLKKGIRPSTNPDYPKKGGTNDFHLNEKDVPSSGHFFAYFLTAVVICISGYVIFHNKQKILAFIIEGRDAASGGRKRTNNGVKYSQLQSNVEEVIPSLDKATSVKNFVY